jgi:hypothetical protein
MKKVVFIFSLFSFLFSLIAAHAYTQTDVSNAQFLADKWIIVKQSTTAGYRLDSTITRAELVGIALKLKWVTLPSYQCKWYFSDVRNNDWICRAVELAADNSLVTRANARFRAQDNITRAEALAIVMKAGWLSDHSPLIDPGMSFIDANWWQSNILRIAENLKLVDFVKQPNNSGMGGLNIYFYPNRSATRAEVFGFVRNIVSPNRTWVSCSIGTAIISDSCINDWWLLWDVVKYGDIIDTFTYWDTPYHGYECSIEYFQNGGVSLPLSGIPKYTKINWIDAIQFSPWEGWPVYVVLSNDGFYYINSFSNIEKCFARLKITDSRKHNMVDILSIYYKNILTASWAYQMRSPAGVSSETFQSWYKNVSSITFREDTLKNLWNNTYEFLVDMIENWIKSTYKVKSTVNLENFTIDNISSVKQ